MENLGQRIRMLRTQKGISLNDFAEKLGVSSGYLSNLETGKTETVQLQLLEKLQNELNLFPSFDLFDKQNDEFMYRIERVSLLLKELSQENMEYAKYLLSVVEQGIDVHKKD